MTHVAGEASELDSSLDDCLVNVLGDDDKLFTVIVLSTTRRHSMSGPEERLLNQISQINIHLT